MMKISKFTKKQCFENSQMLFGDDTYYDEDCPKPKRSNKQQSFEKGYILEEKFVDVRQVVFNNKGRRIKENWDINNSKDVILPINQSINLEQFQKEIPCMKYKGIIESCKIHVGKTVAILIITFTVNIQGTNLRAEYKLFKPKTEEISVFLIENLGLDFAKNKTAPLSTLKGVEVIVELEKRLDETDYYIRSLTKRKTKEKKTNGSK